MFPRDMKMDTRAVEEDDEGDMSKLISDPELHGFYPIKQIKYLSAFTNIEDQIKTSHQANAKNSHMSDDKVTN